MQTYGNLGGKSNIKEYEIGDTYIDVLFASGAVYRYSYASAGKEKVEMMKKLAFHGEGLNSYIMRNARKEYEKHW